MNDFNGNNFNGMNMNGYENNGSVQRYSGSAEPAPPPAKPPKKRRPHTTAKVVAVLAGVIIVGSGAGFGGAYLANRTFAPTAVTSNSTSKPEKSESSTNTSAPTLDEMQSGVTVPQQNLTSNVEFKTDGSYMYTRDLVNAVRDSIVYIETYVENRGTKVPVGAASGIIISKDGYIVTNNHVVEDSTGYTVKVFSTDITTGITDAQTYEAELCGTDADTDLAVLKIDAENLPAAKLGDSDKLSLGDDVIAIGNPLGYQSSVSKGIISGLNRQVSDSKRSLTAIQTDAPINSGNSGGALFNSFGEVVGIVNEKRVDSYAESMGFAITINEAKDVIEDLVRNGYVTGRAILGITYLEINEMAAAYRGDIAGWQVKEINEDLPVAQSGLTVGDTIVEIDGKSVLDDDVQNIFSEKQPGDTVTVTVVRINALGREKNVDIEVELSEYKGD